MAKLEPWEAALVKAMCAAGGRDDQTILAYFTRPTRSVNHREIGGIRKGRLHVAVPAASADDLAAWLAVWPDRDERTGLSLRGDELLVKAREAMIAAVNTFNSAGLLFRAELYIVTCIIAWTYLAHAWFRREGIDYTYRDVLGNPMQTPGRADKYWDLSKCLNNARIPIDEPAKTNLRFLIEIRHEIEHQCTSRIDEALSAKLQACCINFNECIKAMFGSQYGLEGQLSIALQFMTFDGDQALAIKKASGLPARLEAHINAFHNRLSEEQKSDPRFAYRYAFVPIHANNAKAADQAIRFVKADSALGQEIAVFLKRSEATKYRPSHIVRKMVEEGFTRFKMHHHTTLSNTGNYRQPEAGFGVTVAGQWLWYDNWLQTVRDHCQRNANLYMPQDVFA